MSNKERLELELVTTKMMIYSLYENDKKILEAISPKTKMEDLEVWENECIKCAIDWINKTKESEK